MSQRKPSHSIDTAVGRVNATALEELQKNFDTHELLELVEALDEWRGPLATPTACARTCCGYTRWRTRW
jgi:hypothetical protein